MNTPYLSSAIKQFLYYKKLGDQTFEQLAEEDFFWQHDRQSNSIAIIVKHVSGNMLSRWTDFLTTDGEKSWRDRDGEFENDLHSRQDVLNLWELGWKTFLDTLNSLKAEDLESLIYIRNEGHSVLEAINRQLSHYPYHIGQIVFIGKMLTQNWKSLSIPTGNSAKFNSVKFAEVKQIKHFTDELHEPGKELG